MISIENLSKSFGAHTLFENISFKINHRERVGLVGRNGHGKTTLLKMIVGEESADGGDILTPVPTSADLDGENYRIVGMQIRAPYSSVTIEYHKEHARCTAPTTTISLPSALQSVLTDATWYLALGNRAAASQLLYGVAKQQSSRGVSELPETTMLIGG